MKLSSQYLTRNTTTRFKGW